MKTLWYHYLDTVQACKTQKRKMYYKNYQ